MVGGLVGSLGLIIEFTVGDAIGVNVGIINGRRKEGGAETTQYIWWRL